MWQALFVGLAIGSIYALVGMGFTLIWKSMSLVNFAQGDLFMIGAYFGYTIYSIFKLPLWIAIIGSMVCTGLVAALLQRVVLGPLRDSSPMNLVLLTIAASILLENIAQVVWGPDALSLPPLLHNTGLHIGSVIMNSQYLVIMLLSIFAILIFYWFFARTRLGKAMRASSLDSKMALSVGINVNLMNTLAFMISGMLGGLAGVLLAPVTFITPTMGSLIGLISFTAAVVGGFDYVYGALIGGLLIGVLESYFTRYLSSSYSDMISFVVLLIVLRFRPSGILGFSHPEKV